MYLSIDVQKQLDQGDEKKRKKKKKCKSASLSRSDWHVTHQVNARPSRRRRCACVPAYRIKDVGSIKQRHHYYRRRLKRKSPPPTHPLAAPAVSQRETKQSKIKQTKLFAPDSQAKQAWSNVRCCGKKYPSHCRVCIIHLSIHPSLPMCLPAGPREPLMFVCIRVFPCSAEAQTEEGVSSKTRKKKEKMWKDVDGKIRPVSSCLLWVGV